MGDLTLFHLFRRLLLTVVSTYAFIRLVLFIANWQAAGRAADRHEKVFRRYLELSVLRAPLRRFWRDWLQLAALSAILIWVITLHR